MKNPKITKEEVDQPHELLNTHYPMADNRIDCSDVRMLQRYAELQQRYSELQRLRIQELEEEIQILKQELGK